ncbi:major facilitator superfamily protein [Salinispora arenicola]|uniref:Major facilitator superfamily protein n=1 Tax=Salinispora arenicola TaxID=168697 RepID=A0ABQ4JXU0_SALAC|nr:major facilitator superfamily protein [Salinispora arenicola]
MTAHPELRLGEAVLTAGSTPVSHGPTTSGDRTSPGWSPWRTVIGFGVVSLAADMVYEGARSVYGPLLASLGASALIVGLITGAGEAAALVLRLVSGPLADRTRRYWTLTIVGYALTAVCVPLLAVTPRLGAAGLVLAGLLIVAERLGKAVRSPAKSALLAEAAGAVGMGRGMGVHKALDQVGAFAGPLLLAALAAAAGGLLWPGLAALAVPGALAMVMLVVIRRRTEPVRPPGAADGHRTERGTIAPPTSLPASFVWFAVACALCTAGLMTFGLIGFHLAQTDVVPAAGVPLLYAVAMAAAAAAALATGTAYDRIGARVLLVLPVLVAVVPPLAFTTGLAVAAAGVVVWGAALGVQDSTVKAFVADLVPRQRRATAYGIFAAVQGAGALVGGVTAGTLYESSLTWLLVAVAAAQAVAILILVPVLARPHAR